MKSLSIKFHTVSGEPIIVKNITGYESFQSFIDINTSFKWVTFKDVAVPMDKVIKIEELKL